MSKGLAVIVSMLIGVGSGVVISTAILAFIVAIGIIPRLVEKTNTRSHFLAIGTAAVLGSSVGSSFSLYDFYIPLPKVLIALLALCIGMFIGCLAVALAEVLNVMPIAKRRIHFVKGIRLILLCFALSKLVGSLLYWFHPAFQW